MAGPFTADYLHLYVLTDATALGARDVCDAVADAITGGATMVQYREKSADRNTMYTNALRLRELTKMRRIPFVINDYVDLALAIEADGVHLGQADLPLSAARRVAGDRLWFGVSTHSTEQASTAAKDAPSYLAVGPVFTTSSKENPDPAIGLAGVRAVRDTIGPAVPLVAIGGITAVTASEVRAAGANGVSVIAAAWTGDIVEACRKLSR